MLLPRKQRTRQHVIADLSIHHVEGFVLEEGHTVFRLTPDYGYDLVVFTHDEGGYLEPGSIFFQVKATEALQSVGSSCVFDLDIRDFNLWKFEEMPIILVLYDASRSRACWICVQNYFADTAARRPKRGAKTVRVRVPARQVVSRKAVSTWRDLKWQARYRAPGRES